MAYETFFEFQASGASTRDIEEVILSEFGNDHFEKLYGTTSRLRDVQFHNKNITITLSIYQDYVDKFVERLKNYIENTCKAHYNFTPDFYVNFRYGKHVQDYQTQIEETKFINCILKNFSGDAIYSLEHGMPRLWRRQGTLYLSTRDKIWWDSCDFDLATLFEMPFEKEEMPFSFE